MKQINRRVAQILKREFIEGTVYRTDLDRVDVVPAGSAGVLRSLPLTGDRDKVQPGDPVKILTVGGERVVLVGDLALDASIAEVVEDTSEIETAERFQYTPALTSNETGADEGQGWDGWVLFDDPLSHSSTYAKVVASSGSQSATVNAYNMWGIPKGAEAVLLRINASDSGSAAAGTCHFGVTPYQGNVHAEIIVQLAGVTNSKAIYGSGLLKIASDGSFAYFTNTPGTNTMTFSILCFGYKMPAVGNASANKGGWVYPLTPLTHTSWSSTAKTTTGWTAIDATTFGVPAGCQAILAQISARDSGSAASTSGLHFSLAPTGSGGTYYQLYVPLDGENNDSVRDQFGIIRLNEIDQFSAYIKASGSLTMDCTIHIWGYLLGEESVASGWVFIPPVRGANWLNRMLPTVTRTSSTSINAAAEFGIPAEATAVQLRVDVQDSGSGGVLQNHVALYGNANDTYASYIARCGGIANNAVVTENAIINLDASGNLYYGSIASGGASSTLQVNLMCTGFLLPASVEMANAATLDGYPLKRSGSMPHVVLSNPDGTLNADTATNADNSSKLATFSPSQFADATVHVPLTDATGSLRVQTLYAESNLFVTGSIRQSTAVYVRVKRTTNQTISHNTVTPISFDTTLYDQVFDQWSLAAPTQLFCRLAGVYVITGHIQVAASTLGTRRNLSIRLNGVHMAGQQNFLPHASTPATMTVTATVYMALNEYAELVLYHDAGAGQTLTCIGTTDGNTTSYNTFEMVRIA